MWGGDIIGMTAVPEVVLANEAGLCYASISMVTDYDCWRDDHDPVGFVCSASHASVIPETKFSIQIIVPEE